MLKKQRKLENETFIISLSDEQNPIPESILGKSSGKYFANAKYIYHVKVEKESGQEVAGNVCVVQCTPANVTKSSKEYLFEGNFVDSDGKEIGLSVCQRFVISENDNYFEEYITIKNNTESKIRIQDMDFGFRLIPKLTTDFRAVAVPFRRQIDNKLHDYSYEDIIGKKYENSNWSNLYCHEHQAVVDVGKVRSEGWILTDGEEGLLVTKYNQDMIEFSMLGCYVDDGTPSILFGGVGFALYKEPAEACELQGNSEITFGKTRYTFYKGGWPEGYKHFKEFMKEKGHVAKPDYDPPVNWNELYDVGWHHSKQEHLKKHYTRKALFFEAEKAKTLGCDLLYLDPGWEVCEGTTLWAEERLGEVKDFVAEIKKRFDMDVAFRTIGHVYRDEFPSDWYLQNSPSDPKHIPKKMDFVRTFNGVREDWTKTRWTPCFQNEKWLEEKLKRILKVAEAGMKFIMFDEFDWIGPCYDPSHGHPVPSSVNGHVKSVYWLIEQVHKRFPDILIEAHDPVWPWQVTYLPMYYRHNTQAGYDEKWGFEFMWKPLENILKKQATSLYYYNLAYDIPTYDHICMAGPGSDNDNCLSFWWYASTIRHLGFGGKKGFRLTEEDQPRYDNYKAAMKTYRALKKIYTQGTFFGINEETHLHYLKDEGRGVINFFNLSEEPRKEQIKIDFSQIVGDRSINNISMHDVAFVREDNIVTIEVDIPPVSPTIIEFRLE